MGCAIVFFVNRKEGTMKFHVTATSGSEDPTKATLAFLHARGAKEAGHDVTISLLGDSVVMLNPTIAKNIQGVGLPPLVELIGFAKDNGIAVYA
jgi:predicted peroxiredoxin